MRIELNDAGAVLNSGLPDDSGRGEWYPDDTVMALEDAAGRPLGRGPMRIARDRQRPGWARRAGRVWNGDRWIEAEAGAVLAARKRALQAEVDDYAGDVRSEYITSSPGQEGVYMVKREQAKAYLAAGEPADTSEYEMVQARADAYDQTPGQAARVILQRAKALVRVGAQTERHRERGKRLIAAAADEDAAIDARNVAVAALDALRPT